MNTVVCKDFTHIYCQQEIGTQAWNKTCREIRNSAGCGKCFLDRFFVYDIYLKGKWIPTINVPLGKVLLLDEESSYE